MSTRPLLGAASLLILPLPALLYIRRKAAGSPDNEPFNFVSKGLRKPGAKVVVCVGDSLTHGRISFDVIDLLSRRLEDEGFQFVNGGKNGDVAYNAFQRVPEVIACRPDFVTVMLGTNDVLATLDADSEKHYRHWNKLPTTPTLPSYRENLRAIVRSLRRETQAKIALASLPLIGEDLASEENRKTAAYSEVVKDVAKEESVAYLPVRERMVEALEAERGHLPRGFQGRKLMIKALLHRYLLGQSFDDIAQKHGYVLLSDGFHLNARSGAMVAEEIEAFLKGKSSGARGE